jgi:hypothetical protein
METGESPHPKSLSLRERDSKMSMYIFAFSHAKGQKGEFGDLAFSSPMEVANREG